MLIQSRTPTRGARRGHLLSALAGALILLAAAACRIPTGLANSNQPSSSFAFIWLGSYKDAFVSCGRVGPPCPEGNNNYGRHGSLGVACCGVAFQKSYIQFGLPILPSGSVVEEAFFEMYHGGKNEDGTSDDVIIPLALAAGPWTVAGITLANEPNRSTSGAFSSIKLRSMGWSGSPNIASTVRDWYANPGANNGLNVYWPGPSVMQKGFYSNNDVRRRVNDLGLSPRLLIKVRLPAGATPADVTIPPLPADTDLPFPGQTVLMALIQTGADWPAQWDVRRGM